MRLHPRRRKFWVLGLIALCALVLSCVAAADPPARVARLAHISGAVSFSPAGEEEWVQATANRPLISGDRVWVDAGARAELQFGGAAIRLGSSTSVAIINLDDRVAQFQLTQGTVNVRVLRLGPDGLVEVDTPQLAFTMRRPGEVRIDVDAQGATAIAMQRGEGEAWGESAAFTIAAGQWYRFPDRALRNYQSDVLPAPDDFDRWAYDRDRREDRAVSARYVAPEVIGYADLDDYGSWSVVESYGNVWIPASVPSGWAPYRYGHWAWIEPWGWTWVDDAPWGFAPFHYGRWAYLRERWCWVPGPVRARPVYAPALVAFVGGGNFSLSLSSGPGIAWFPLGPGEVYRPAYRVSRNYFTNINVSNTQINTTYVTNVYNNAGAASTRYQHQQRPNAVTAVPANAFVQSRPVAQAAVPVSAETISRAPATPFATLAPTRASVIGAGAVPAGPRPPSPVLQRPVLARTAPPPPATSFAVRQPALAKEPGKPLDPAAAAALAPAARVTTAPIKLVTPAQTGAPTPAPQTLSRPGTALPSEAARTVAPPQVPTPPGPPPGGAPSGTVSRTPPPTANVPPPAPPAGAASSGTVNRAPPPTANVPPPRLPAVSSQPAITASPPSGPASAPPNAPAYAPARPTPPSAATEARRVPAPPGAPGVGEAAAPAPPAATIAKPPAPQPAPAPEVKRVPPSPPTTAPAPPPATIAKPPAPQPAPAPEVKRVPPPPPTVAPAPPPATIAKPPTPQPAPAPEVKRVPPPPQNAAPPTKAEGAKPEGRGAPRQEEGKPKQEDGKAKPEEKKQEVK